MKHKGKKTTKAKPKQERCPKHKRLLSADGTCGSCVISDLLD